MVVLYLYVGMGSHGHVPCYFLFDLVELPAPALLISSGWLRSSGGAVLLGCNGSALARVLRLLLKCRIIGLLLCVVERVRGSILLLLLLLLSLVVGYADLFRWARWPGLARLFSFSGLAGHLAFDEVTM